MKKLIQDQSELILKVAKLEKETLAVQGHQIKIIDKIINVIEDNIQITSNRFA